MEPKEPNPASIFEDWTGFPDAGAPVRPPPRTPHRRRRSSEDAAPADMERLAAFLLSLEPRAKLSFLEHLAHELTVAMRLACEDEALPDPRKIGHARRINEILHRVVLRIRSVRLGRDRWREEEFAGMVFEWTEGESGLLPCVVAALRRAYDYLHERGS